MRRKQQQLDEQLTGRQMADTANTNATKIGKSGSNSAATTADPTDPGIIYICLFCVFLWPQSFCPNRHICIHMILRTTFRFTFAYHPPSINRHATKRTPLHRSPDPPPSSCKYSCSCSPGDSSMRLMDECASSLYAKKPLHPSILLHFPLCAATTQFSFRFRTKHTRMLVRKISHIYKRRQVGSILLQAW